jgi:hypothetical protein
MNTNMKWFLPVMFLIFMTLKLTDCIDWSWWWVSAPLWIPFIIGIVCLVIFTVLEAARRK